jgi:hypothetical protein
MASTTFFAITPTTSPEAMALLQTLVASGALQTVVPAPGEEPTPTTPLGTAQDVLAAIPVAEDGEVIRSGYHNSLRDALQALLAEVAVGRGPVAPLSPALLQVGQDPQWAIGPGVAQAQAPPTGKADANGWLPLELPHGGYIQNLTVSGRRTGSMKEFTLELARQAISTDQQPQTDVLASDDLSNETAAFLKALPATSPTTANLTAQQVEERRRIDNTKFKYYVTAVVTQASNGAVAQLNSIQVVVTRV